VQCGDDMCKPILSALLVLAPLTLGLVACAPPDEHDSGVGAGGGAGGGTGGAIGSGGGTGTGGLGEAGGAESAITTTRTALLSNNTSASTAFMDVYTPAARFHGSTTPVSNADAPTSNIPLAGMERGAVSKVPVQSLLYPGATTKVFVETQGWFCTNGKDPIPTTDPADQCGGHIDIGYDSNATAHVQAAVADMVSRGFNGAILDWNGPDGQDDGMGAVNQHTTDVVDISAGNATLMMQTAETTGGKLQFALQEDEGMQKCASTPGCDVTSKVASDLDFMAAHYYTSSAYQTLGGRPVAYFFGVDHAAEAHGKTVDWTTIRAQAQKNPLFIFETGDGFTHAETDGAYAWLQPTDLSKYPGSDPFGTTTYLPDFYKQAEAHPTLHAFGSIYKGFDDLDVNGWGGSGGSRYIGQQCGKTWLDTFAEVGKYFSSTHQLEALEVPTWDDYEEGSEIETGIESYVEVTASVSGSTLRWSIAPTTTMTVPADCKTALAGGFSLDATIHHYDVYSSPKSDGENLTLVAGDLPASTKSVDLTGKIPAGAHVLYIQAVSQPSIKNHLSAAVPWG
jgi:hypothetical protein